MAALYPHTDWGATGRRDTYSFALVDPHTMQEVGPLEADAAESSVTFALDSDHMASAKIRRVNWPAGNLGLDRMIRVTHTATAADGTQAREVLGTFFPSIPKRTAKNGTALEDVECVSALAALSQDVTDDTFHAPAGSNVVGNIRRLVSYAGRPLSVAPGVDTARLHTVDIFREKGENRLDFVREYAGWIGCTISPAPSGAVSLEPKVQANTQQPVYRFADTAAGVHVAGFSLSVPDAPLNHVLAWWSSDTATPWGYSGRAVADLPATSPFSFESMGRRFSESLEVTEPCSPEELQGRASEHLVANAAAATVEITHASVPGLMVGDIVTFSDSSADVSPVIYTCRIKQMEMTLGPFCLCRTTLEILDWLALAYGRALAS